jgi:hypothetical protein
VKRGFVPYRNQSIRVMDPRLREDDVVERVDFFYGRRIRDGLYRGQLPTIAARRDGHATAVDVVVKPPAR